MSAAPRDRPPPSPDRSSATSAIGSRSGDLGTLPVFFALLLIVIFFQVKNSNYLSAGNFNNLIVQMSGEALIAMGVVFVLLLGEIDLSVGFVSGIGAVLVAEFLLQGGSFQLPEWSIGGFAITPYIAIVLAVAAGCLIGFAQGVFVAVIGVPSFIVTLAGLLIWQGVLLAIIGNGGTVVIQDVTINNTATYFMAPVYAWIFAAIAIVAYAMDDAELDAEARCPGSTRPGLRHREGGLHGPRRHRGRGLVAQREAAHRRRHARLPGRTRHPRLLPRGVDVRV